MLFRSFIESLPFFGPYSTRRCVFFPLQNNDILTGVSMSGFSSPGLRTILINLLVCDIFCVFFDNFSMKFIDSGTLESLEFLIWDHLVSIHTTFFFWQCRVISWLRIHFVKNFILANESKERFYTNPAIPFSEVLLFWILCFESVVFERLLIYLNSSLHSESYSNFLSRFSVFCS